jgi:propanol-preferring alcohol dehydrogenase
MKAMLLEHIAQMSRTEDPLVLAEVPEPIPDAHELLLQVITCGVCHTELDEIEGRLPPPQLPVIPGHQVIARVVDAGVDADRNRIGSRVGVGWIHHSDGSEFENLSPEFCGTGCDANGGYAEFMTVPAHYAVPIPDAFDDAAAAPLLCAGAIGYRALRLANITDGDPLGLMGFGGSAHLVLQLARYLYPASPIYVFARSPSTHEFARGLGATWAGTAQSDPPTLARAIIDTTPVWLPVVASLEHLAPGGRLVINAIRKESSDQAELLNLSYHDHLWMERELKSVANITRDDIAEFVQLAAAAGIRPEVEVYGLEEANDALRSLRFGPVRGAKVLQIAGV